MDRLFGKANSECSGGNVNPLAQLLQHRQFNQSMPPSSILDDQQAAQDQIQAALIDQHQPLLRQPSIPFENPSEMFYQPPPELLQKLPSQQNEEWIREYESFSREQQATRPADHSMHVNHAAFENAWSAASVMQRMPPNALVTAKETKQWDREFLQELDKNWIEDFTAAESSAVKGKEKADWDQMFSAIEAGRIEQTETVKNKLAADDEFSKTFEDTWKTLENVELSESISQQLNKQQQDTETPISDELDYARWDDEMASLSAPPKIMETKDYAFEPSNKYLQHSDPYAEGVRIVESGGSLTEAALAFEAAVQLDSRHANAWAYLGKVQAENEKEEPAIAALQQAIKENPQHLEALMALAVSYTNEGYDQQAFMMLDQWMAVQYPDIHQQASTGKRPMQEMPVYELYDHVSGQLMQAARNQREIDANVQVALGVLFYNAGQYDKSVDCFEAAVKVRPKDYLLWNRLGATLANSGRSEEAITAYYNALDIKPSFVRGRYNLGVSCMNIGCYKEAAEHFLTALLMHQTPSTSTGGGKQNESSNLWETLRRTFLLMERPDLSELAVAGTDLQRFREEFDF